jgi:hypothetical protein
VAGTISRNFTVSLDMMQHFNLISELKEVHWRNALNIQHLRWDNLSGTNLCSLLSVEPWQGWRFHYTLAVRGDLGMNECYIFQGENGRQHTC